MPPLGLHMTIARQLAADLASPDIDADRGAYYLGATTPDIRVLTKWERERTHFFSLDDFGEQSGVHRLFESEPALRNAASLDAPTTAFMAGYISHLVLDESYICQIYRPLFGSTSDLANDLMSNLMDRVLQYELDRHDREDAIAVTEIHDALAESAVEVSIGFIGRDTLLEWRGVATTILEHPPTWERFGRMATRHLAAAGVEGEEGVARFVAEVPALLQRTIDHVGEERIHEYLHSAKNKARATMKEYLS